MDRIEKGILTPTVKEIEGVHFSYCLIEHNGKYGLKVLSTDRSEKTVLIDGISQDIGEVERLRDLLADNFVSPCHVLEVLDDLLGS